VTHKMSHQKLRYYTSISTRLLAIW